MMNPWLALSLIAFQISLEARSVVALRLLRLATGGARARTEAGRMVTEKVLAVGEVQTVAAVSSTMQADGGTGNPSLNLEARSANRAACCERINLSIHR